jgi:CRP/FNR family transcriptional regulator, anaerobic regulatory protein
MKRKCLSVEHEQQGHLSQTMIRTNDKFLDHLDKLYEDQSRPENIRIKNVTARTLLFKQGSHVQHVLLIREGFVKCFISQENDKEFIVEFLGRGEIIGELESLQKISCLCSVETMVETSVYVLSLPYFELLRSRDMAFNELLLNVFAQRIIETSTRASFQQSYNVDTSLERLLDMQKRNGLDLSKENMAAYLGITVRSLNRSLSKLRRKN